MDCGRALQARHAGRMATTFFRGYAGIERHNYQQMPLYPLIEAGVLPSASSAPVSRCARCLSPSASSCCSLVLLSAERRRMNEWPRRCACWRFRSRGDAGDGLCCSIARGSTGTTSPCPCSASWRFSPSIAPSDSARAHGISRPARLSGWPVSVTSTACSGCQSSPRSRSVGDGLARESGQHGQSSLDSPARGSLWEFSWRAAIRLSRCDDGRCATILDPLNPSFYPQNSPIRHRANLLRWCSP